MCGRPLSQKEGTMTTSKGGFGDNKNDQDRAEIRGKGREPDFDPGSDEGTRQMQEPGKSGDTTSLRGQKTGSQNPPHNEKLRTDRDQPEGGNTPGRGDWNPR
jgi:hypothetical protein